MDNLTKIEDRLFLIVGCGRSGTTLLKTILNAHPEVAIPHETFFFNGIARNKLECNLNLDERTALVASKWWIRSMGIDKDQLKKNLGERDPSWRNLFLSLLDAACHDTAPKYFGEKTVANIRFAERLLEEYPKCRIVQIIRDPRAAYLSFKSAKVGTNQVAPLIRDWQFAINVDRRLAEHPRYQSIKFEDLIKDTQLTMQKVCTGLGVPFHPQMMKFHERSEKGYSSVQEHHANTTRPIFSTGLSKWKSNLTVNQIGMIEHFLGDSMTQYGYELTGAKVSSPDVRLRFSWFADGIWKWCVGRPRAQIKKFMALRKLKTITAVR